MCVKSRTDPVDVLLPIYAIYARTTMRGLGLTVVPAINCVVVSNCNVLNQGLPAACPHAKQGEVMLMAFSKFVEEK